MHKRNKKIWPTSVGAAAGQQAEQRLKYRPISTHRVRFATYGCFHWLGQQSHLALVCRANPLTGWGMVQ